MKDSLRLMLFPHCDRACKLCCNGRFQLEDIPIYDWKHPFKEYILTGGEPMLKPELVKDLAREIKDMFDARVYMYTARTMYQDKLAEVVELLDGVTVTLHDKYDVEPFLEFHKLVEHQCVGMGKSMWLNVFKGIKLPEGNFDKFWNIKEITWIKDCPVPQHEEFMRLDPAVVGSFDELVHITTGTRK